MGKILVLSVNDLNSPEEYDGTMQSISVANRIRLYTCDVCMFVDGDGRVFVLKNRYGKTGEVIQ